MLNFNQIKQEWEMSGESQHLSLEEYARQNFTPIYNPDLDFVGWQRHGTEV